MESHGSTPSAGEKKRGSVMATRAEDAAHLVPYLQGLSSQTVQELWTGGRMRPRAHIAAACRRFASQPAFALEFLGMTLKNCMALTPGCARSAWRRPPGWRTGRRHAFGDPCRFIAEALGEDDEVDDLGRVGAARHGDADPVHVLPLVCETRGQHAQT